MGGAVKIGHVKQEIKANQGHKPILTKPTLC